MHIVNLNAAQAIEGAAAEAARLIMGHRVVPAASCKLKLQAEGCRRLQAEGCRLQAEGCRLKAENSQQPAANSQQPAANSQQPTALLKINWFCFHSSWQVLATARTFSLGLRPCSIRVYPEGCRLKTAKSLLQPTALLLNGFWFYKETVFAQCFITSAARRRRRW